MPKKPAVSVLRTGLPGRERDPELEELGGDSTASACGEAGTGWERRPAVGATLCATVLTSLADVSFFALLAWISGAAQVAPDWRQGLLLGLGGIIGMYLGVRMQKFVPAFALKTMLVLVLLGTALRYLTQGL